MADRNNKCEAVDISYVVVAMADQNEGKTLTLNQLQRVLKKLNDVWYERHGDMLFPEGFRKNALGEWCLKSVADRYAVFGSMTILPVLVREVGDRTLGQLSELISDPDDRLEILSVLETVINKENLCV